MKRRHVIAGVFGMFAALFAPATAEAQLFGRGSAQGTGGYDAGAWVIADSTTGVVLDSSNASRRLQVGSITKIATAMVLLDWVAAKSGSLSELATVPDTIAPLASPNSIGLQTGDRIALREALYAAMMQSDNQAAETIAVHVGRRLGGGETDRDAANYFVSQMNALSRKLGMRSTRFLNAHGLDDLEKTTPYSTAGDIALLANYAVGHSGFTFYTSQKDRKVTWSASTGELASSQIKNTNELLGGIIDGMKTGTTRKAGPCLVATAAKPPESRQEGEKFLITPRRLTVIVLDSPTRFDTARSLLERGWGLLDEWAAAGRPLKGWRTKR